jgi:hypothetical protein
MPHDGRRREDLAMAPPQSCLSVTVELLLMGPCFVECVLISLPIEEHCVTSKTAVFWDTFHGSNKKYVVSWIMSYGSSKTIGRFRGTYRLHVQVSRTLRLRVRSEDVSRRTAKRGSCNGTSTVVFIRYRGITVYVFLRNVSSFYYIHPASYPRRQHSSSSPQWNPQISQRIHDILMNCKTSLGENRSIYRNGGLNI